MKRAAAMEAHTKEAKADNDEALEVVPLDVVLPPVTVPTLMAPTWMLLTLAALRPAFTFSVTFLPISVSLLLTASATVVATDPAAIDTDDVIVSVDSLRRLTLISLSPMNVFAVVFERHSAEGNEEEETSSQTPSTVLLLFTAAKSFFV
jgi:hypothetical protein